MRVAVSVVTFSRNKKLAQELARYFPDVRMNELGRRYTKEELAEALRDADAAIVGLDTIDEDLLRSCPNLKVIVKHGIGTDRVDFEACEKHGVEVKTQSGTNKRSVAELTLAFMTGLMRGGYASSVDLKHGSWNKYDNGGRNLTGKTIGIIGVGNIGKDVVHLLQPFDCAILVNDIREDVEQREFYEKYGLKACSKDDILRQADIVTLHTPLTETTKYMIGKEQMEAMKQTAYLINTARGEIVREEDLLWALENGVIAGAGLDVYGEEPPNSPELVACKNVYATPHIGGTSQEASLALGMTAITSLRAHFGI